MFHCYIDHSFTRSRNLCCEPEWELVSVNSILRIPIWTLNPNSALPWVFQQRIHISKISSRLHFLICKCSIDEDGRKLWKDSQDWCEFETVQYWFLCKSYKKLEMWWVANFFILKARFKYPGFLFWFTLSVRHRVVNRFIEESLPHFWLTFCTLHNTFCEYYCSISVCLGSNTFDNVMLCWQLYKMAGGNENSCSSWNDFKKLKPYLLFSFYNLLFLQDSIPIRQDSLCERTNHLSMLYLVFGPNMT